MLKLKGLRSFQKQLSYIKIHLKTRCVGAYMFLHEFRQVPVVTPLFIK